MAAIWETGDDLKRWTLRICVFLVLGAIVNVAVAWGCVAVGRIQQSLIARSVDPSDSPYFGCAANVDRWFGGARVELWQQWDFGGMWQDMQMTKELPAWASDVRPRESDSANAGKIHRVVQGSGWPLCAMIGGFEYQVVSTGSISVASAPANQWWAILIPKLNDDQLGGPGSIRLLPLYPIWPGFAINTVFYAVVIWMLLTAPFALRRRSRRRRGLCVKCGYDLRGGRGAGSAAGPDAITCPECGATATP